MRKSVVACCSLAMLFVCSGTQASTVVDIGSTTFLVPQDGVLSLGGPIAAPLEGTFRIIGGPNFTGSGFAILTMNATVDGASYSIQTSLGSCPVGNCGSFPYVTDNVYGQHLGPGGYSTFLVSAALDPALTITSNWTLQSFQGNIAVPADYQVEINLWLPATVAAVPELSTWAMLLIGFIGIGGLVYRRSHTLVSSR